jgi:DNA-binding MarR family transcriptional regulator
MCVTHANQETPREQMLADLDHAFVRLRRLVAKPPTGLLELPGGGKLDLAKVLACEAIADLSGGVPATVKEVAGYLDLEPSTASRLLSDAQADGLLSREQNPRDRRSTVVRLTADGERLVALTRPMRLGYLGHVTAEWASDDLSRLAELVGRFADSVAEGREGFTTCAQDHSSAAPRTSRAMA